MKKDVPFLQNFPTDRNPAAGGTTDKKCANKAKKGSIQVYPKILHPLRFFPLGQFFETYF
ncbi:hypothetical protein L0337_06470 [candidate division KSB1 bacterium]|nr:hypothetical protein [candidate division KSB1 bacterium]